MAWNKIAKTAPEPPGTPSPMDADIRWWAAHNKIMLDPGAPIPDKVREQYREAMEQAPGGSAAGK